MNKFTLLREVKERLPPRLQRKVSNVALETIFEAICDTIIDVTTHGEPVAIDRFAIISPHVRPPHEVWGYKQKKLITLSRPVFFVSLKASKRCKEQGLEALGGKLNG
jgi:nucleoid DNA-binding protein